MAVFKVSAIPKLVDLMNPVNLSLYYNVLAVSAISDQWQLCIAIPKSKSELRSEILLIIQRMFNLETDDLAIKPCIPH